MSEKSHVGLEYKVCPATGKKWETGSILLDKHLNNSLEKESVTGWEPCPEVKEKLDAGYQVLVEIDENRSQKPLTPSNVYRLGRIVYVKTETYEQIFNCAAPTHGISFTETAVIEFLENLNKKTDEHKDSNQ